MVVKNGKTSMIAKTVSRDHDAEYEALLGSMRMTFSAAIGSGPVFRTNVEETHDLFAVYIARLAKDDRQQHNCSACRRFVREFGGLVRIDENGRTRSAVWDYTTAPAYYRNAVKAMAAAAVDAKVTGPFVSSSPDLGVASAGGFTHFCVLLPFDMVWKETTKTDRQKAAEKREDFRTVMHAITTIKSHAVQVAADVVTKGAVNRSEKFAAPLVWLRDLQRSFYEEKNGEARKNLVWRAVASAPDGYCHPRAAVTGTLIEDIENGSSFEAARKRFNEKVGGLIYQRPQATPTEGNVKSAEKLVERLGLKASLARRFARLEEIPQFVWNPSRPGESNEKADTGVFDHLLARKKTEASPFDMSMDTPMSWEKFLNGVLPSAEKIEAEIKPERMPFIGILTAADLEAPPIIRWDRAEERNPFSWYVYHRGSIPDSWNLNPIDKWVTVNAVIDLPNLWGSQPQPQHSVGAVLVLDGCRDKHRRISRTGVCLFPELLRSDLHSVRSTIEAYSKTASLQGVEEATVCGLDVRKGSRFVYILRVTSGGVRTVYRIDRWE